MRGVCSSILVLFVFTISILGVLVSTPLAYGAEKEKDLPPRGIALAPEYTGVILPAGDDLSLDVEVFNRGRADEDIDVSLTTVPKGWKASIKTYSFEVSGVHLQSDSSKSLTLKAEPDKDLGPGKYGRGINLDPQSDRDRQGKRGCRQIGRPGTDDILSCA